VPDSRPLANPFAPKGSGIVRVLLEHPDRSWQVQELGREAGVSLGLVSKSKQALVDQGFVRMDAGRVRLQDPEGLLRAWRAAYHPDVEPLDFYVMDDPPKVERALADRCAAADVRYRWLASGGLAAGAHGPRAAKTMLLKCAASSPERCSRPRRKARRERCEYHPMVHP
jgi:hypothetical protein